MRRRGPRPCGRRRPAPGRSPVRRTRAASRLGGERPRNRFTSSCLEVEDVEQVWTADGHERTRARGGIYSEHAGRAEQVKGSMELCIREWRLDTPNEQQEADVLIAGGGFAGLALAIALRQGSGASLPVVVADPALRTRGADAARLGDRGRGAAHVRDHRRLGAVADDAQPILDMVVTDCQARRRGAAGVSDVRRRGRAGRAVRAHDRECAADRGARGEGARAGRRACARPRSTGFRERCARITVRAWRTARRFRARCWSPPTARARACASRRASRRHGWNYGQSAIVTTVAHERDHNGRAEEHFLPAGPFAILPLKGNRSSIVWTETDAEAARIVALPDDRVSRRAGAAFRAASR